MLRHRKFRVLLRVERYYELTRVTYIAPSPAHDCPLLITNRWFLHWMIDSKIDTFAYVILCIPHFYYFFARKA